jgi:cell division protein FtsQ
LFADDYQLRRERPSGGVLFAILTAITLALAALHVLDPRTLPIRHVRINGEFLHLSPASLQEVASDVVRGGFFNVNVDTVRAVLLKEPWVRDVTVRRVWPDALSLHVVEQVPVARWGDAGLLNGDAQLFTPERITWPDGLPRISGPDGTEPVMLGQYRYMNEALGRHGMKVERVDLDGRRSWSLAIGGGPQVVLGRRDAIERFDRFTTVLPGHLMETLPRVAVVDMRYTNGFAVRWKDARGSEPIGVREAHGQEE